jgi:hypothetical protein
VDPRQNPFAPGAGTPPRELAGRADQIEQAAVAVDRIRAGFPPRSLIFHGLRGVGKTVLLTQIRRDAEARGISAVRVEAPENRSLPAWLAPALRATLFRLDRGEALRSGALHAMRVLASFAKLKFKYQDVEVGVGFDPAPGLADSGDLDTDLTDLLTALGEAAAERKTAAILFIDELQQIPEAQFASLITALHHVVQSQLPVALVGVGLPNLLRLAGRAKGYAERLFDFIPLDHLSREAATIALTAPPSDAGVTFTEGAVDEMFEQSGGYPFFIQEWGSHCWDLANGPSIDIDDARRATQATLSSLDAGFFRVRFDQLTVGEKNYMRALAELGPGTHQSSAVADVLGREPESIRQARTALISKNMLYSPTHGEVTFTVPLFDVFMRRTMTLAGRF